MIIFHLYVEQIANQFLASCCADRILFLSQVTTYKGRRGSIHAPVLRPITAPKSCDPSSKTIFPPNSIQSYPATAFCKIITQPLSQPRIAKVQSALEANRSLVWQIKKRLVDGLQNCITDDANMQCL